TCSLCMHRLWSRHFVPAALYGVCIGLEIRSITNVTRRWHFYCADIHSMEPIIHIFSTPLSPVCQARVDELESLDVWHALLWHALDVGTSLTRNPAWKSVSPASCKEPKKLQAPPLLL